MKFHILTLFPEMVRQGLETSITGRAMEKGLIRLNPVNIRDFTLEKHGRVDDYPYGGGAGMLMQAQPVFDAWKSVCETSVRADAAHRGRSDFPEGRIRRPRTIYVTPQGEPFTQRKARELAEEEELVILCGHYEGIDERVLEEVVTDYISIGDYVLTGGELAAMVIVDAVSRLVPGVLGNEVSAEAESFHGDLLEYPQYSRPEVWHGKKVPEVLLSGDHAGVARWRLEKSVERTAAVRPDLYEKYREKQALIQSMAKDKRNRIHMMESLAAGQGEILYRKDGGILVCDREAGVCMLSGESGGERGGRRQELPVSEESRGGTGGRNSELPVSEKSRGGKSGRNSELPVSEESRGGKSGVRPEASMPEESRGGTGGESPEAPAAEAVRHKALLAAVPEDAEWLAVSEERLAEELRERGFCICGKFSQYLYTARQTLPVRCRDIRRLTIGDLEYVSGHLQELDEALARGGESRRREAEHYLLERIRAGAMYGVFAEGRQTGFVGIHRGGGLGLMYVEEGYRRQGMGKALLSHIMNRLLEQGRVPYLHLQSVSRRAGEDQREGAEEAKADVRVMEHLLEKLRLYRAAREIWWLRREP